MQGARQDEILEEIKSHRLKWENSEARWYNDSVTVLVDIIKPVKLADGSLPLDLPTRLGEFIKLSRHDNRESRPVTTHVVC